MEVGDAASVVSSRVRAADALLVGGDPEAAADCYRSIISEAPADAPATLGLLRALVLLDRLPEAVVAADALEAIEPSHIEVPLVRAILAARVSRWGSARRLLDRALAIGPWSPSLQLAVEGARRRIDIGLSLSLGDAAAARRLEVLGANRSAHGIADAVGVGALCLGAGAVLSLVLAFALFVDCLFDACGPAPVRDAFVSAASFGGAALVLLAVAVGLHVDIGFGLRDWVASFRRAHPSGRTELLRW